MKPVSDLNSKFVCRVPPINWIKTRFIKGFVLYLAIAATAEALINVVKHFMDLITFSDNSIC